LKRLFSVEWDERVIMYSELERTAEDAVVPVYIPVFNLEGLSKITNNQDVEYFG
jgi:hypothetical protein